MCSSASVPASELPRTTDVAEIARFVREGGDEYGQLRPRVVFCTYHSAARVSEALQQTGGRIGLLVCDEAHRCTGNTTKRDAQPLFDTFLPAARRLFLTATPRLIASKRDRDGGLVQSGASMDDAALFGPTGYAAHDSSPTVGFLSPSPSLSPTCLVWQSVEMNTSH